MTWEICPICWWEDDGQDDADANENCGGSNGDYSLQEARENFRKLMIAFRPNDERFLRIGTATREHRESLVSAFEKIQREINDVSGKKTSIKTHKIKALHKKVNDLLRKNST